jgi:hypothetical protein
LTLSKYFLDKFLSDWHEPKKDQNVFEVIPENVVILKEAYSKFGPGFRDNSEFLEFQQLVNWATRFDKLSQPADRKDFLLLLIELGKRDVCDRYILWMTNNHRLEIRTCHTEIKKYCLRYLYCWNTLVIVNRVLPQNSRIDFSPLFMSQFEKTIEHKNFSLDNFYCTDAGFITKVQTRMRQEIGNIKECKNLCFLGSLVAVYGELSDLCAGLAYPREAKEFLAGFSLSNGPRRFALSSDMKAIIFSQLLKYIQDSSRPLAGSSSEVLHVWVKERLCNYALGLCSNDCQRKIIVKYAVKSESFISHLHWNLLNRHRIDRKLLSEYDDAEIQGCESFFIEIWKSIEDDGQEYLKECIPALSCLSRDLTHQDLIHYASSQWDRDKVLPVFREIVKTTEELFIPIIQLLAHIFFVDDFEVEIATNGYLGMFKLASLVTEEYSESPLVTRPRE